MVVELLNCPHHALAQMRFDGLYIVITRETVFIDTPACFATSMIVAFAMVPGRWRVSVPNATPEPYRRE